MRGNWGYPELEEVLVAVGLHTIKHYIDVRRQTGATYIVHRLIFKTCKGTERQRGSASRNFWWDQEFNLELARSSCKDDQDMSASKAVDWDKGSDTALVLDDEDND